jgi:hypothetical protein
VSRLAPTILLRRAALLAVLGLGLAAPGAAAQDPAALVEAEIPHDSAISEQYQRVQEVLDQAAAAVPDTPISQPAVDPEPVATPAPAAPEKPPPSDQYHSETPSNVSVTQTQPSNVHVSIRINSPGDDGPVVQINNAGGSAVVEQVQQVVQRPPAQPEPEPEPVQAAGGSLPASWDWTWTSACFGGAPRAGAATAVPGWNWHWSCNEQAGGDAVIPELPGLPRLPDAARAVMDDLPAAPTFAAVMPSAAFAPERPRARPQRRARSSPSGAVARGVGPPPTAGRAPPVQPQLAGLSTHAPPPASAARPRHAERAAAHAQPGPGDGSASTLPSGSGPGLGAATALGSVASLLLGIGLAVLVTASVIVLPRLRHRRWSGLTGRLPRLSSSRLERPG